MGDRLAPTTREMRSWQVVLVVLGILLMLVSIWGVGVFNFTLRDTAPTATVKIVESSTKDGPTSSREASVTGAAKNGVASPITVSSTTSPALSDTAAAGLFAIGLIFVIAGAFYSRITSIKGPGGIEISLPALAGAAKAAVEQQAPAGTAPEAIAAATADATAKLAELSGTQRITADLLTSVAQSSLDKVAGESLHNLE